MEIFFDREAIVEGQDWRRRLGEGLRQSRLFLAFLTPNYITSANCLWEWEEYLRREHSAARGDDGLTPIYFVAPADLAPGNVQRSHEHFIGRHRELSQLHTLMTQGGPQSGGRGMGRRGMIAATFAPGGLGKTALARQYAHAYAEFYAAGGTWEVSCEGASELGAVLLRLADNASFQGLGRESGYVLFANEPPPPPVFKPNVALVDHESPARCFPTGSHRSAAGSPGGLCGRGTSPTATDRPYRRPRESLLRSRQRD